MIAPNSVINCLAQGQLTLGLGVRLARGVEIAIAARTGGFDWLFIDLEHGALSVESASQICLAALQAGVTPIVRVAKDALSEGVRLLDNGAQGVIVAHVDTPEEARTVANRFRYPPTGKRSVTMSLPFFGYGVTAPDQITEQIDPATLVICMIESKEALDNLAAIAEVPGIDILLIGSQDLAIDLGIQSNFADMYHVYSRVASICAARNKWVGMAGVSDDGLAAHCLRLGVRFVLGAMDISLLMRGASASSLHWREALTKTV